MASKKKCKFDTKYRLEINWSPEDDAYVVNVPELPDPKLHRDLMIKAEIDGVSLNKWIESKLKKAV